MQYSVSGIKNKWYENCYVFSNRKFDTDNILLHKATKSS